MRIAVPTANGKLCMHFGHCQQFVLVDVEGEEITKVEAATPPPHAPGVLPKWLHEQGANVIIASGMGMRAQNLFKILLTRTGSIGILNPQEEQTFMMSGKKPIK